MNICVKCSLIDNLKLSSRDNNLYCWSCRIEFNRGRKPTLNEIDHHNGIKRASVDLCKVCTPEDCILKQSSVNSMISLLLPPRFICSP